MWPKVEQAVMKPAFWERPLDLMRAPSRRTWLKSLTGIEDAESSVVVAHNMITLTFAEQKDDITLQVIRKFLFHPHLVADYQNSVDHSVPPLRNSRWFWMSLGSYCSSACGGFDVCWMGRYCKIQKSKLNKFLIAWHFIYLDCLIIFKTKNIINVTDGQTHCFYE